MEIVKIEWIKTNYREIKEYYDTYYYAFSRGNSLLYIGISYKQNVKTEIDQTLRRLGINTTGLSIWLGYLNSDATTYSRITEQIIKDVECLMIYTNQPICNTQCKENYTGRCNIKVRTSGCPLIRKCVRCENNRVYLSC